jgi:hypothetical protein
MKNQRFDRMIRRASALPALLCLFACANVGNPNGGPYDEDPPKFVGAKPAMNQLNFTGKKIEVFFDEFITIDNPSEQVIVTPPQIQAPIIRAVGKKAMVELKDTLKENTTYTIDFTSSITDNTEKNVLKNFSYAFSTGDVLDTMKIGGVLLNAQDLEPMQKAIVGIHSNLADTAFTKTPLLRTSKTDDRGRFIIHNIAPGSYHVFALEDKNRNYIYDKNNDESLAFLDSIVIPSCERGLVPDTIWKDTITVDTVFMVERTLFYPNDLVLWYFNDSIMPRQRMLRPERQQDYIFTLKFNAPLDTFPQPVPLNFEPADSIWYVTQKGQDPESFALNYWILDSMIYRIDTLQVEVSYWKNNDTIPDLIELQTDTLSLVNRESAQRKKREAKPKKPVKVRKTKEGDAESEASEEPPVIPLQVSISPSGSINPYDVITVAFNEPVMDVRKEFFVMEIAVDSLWEPTDFEFVEDSTRAMTCLIKRPFNYEEQYRITIDSAMLRGVYGHCNDSLTVGMAVKGNKEYGTLKVEVQGLPTVGDSGQVIPAFMELLNSADAAVRKVIVENGVAHFKDMPADSYYARIVLDANGNGIWDYGNYEEKRLPERVIYFMNPTSEDKFGIRQNYDIDEIWDIRAAKPGEKPYELLKNKPKEDTKKKRDYKEESKPRRGSSNMNFRGIGL